MSQGLKDLPSSMDEAFSLSIGLSSSKVLKEVCNHENGSYCGHA